MPLAIILGNGFKELTSVGFAGAKVDPENIALVGIRMLDGPEKELLKKSKVRYFTMREIDEKGIVAVMHEAINEDAVVSSYSPHAIRSDLTERLQ